MSTAELRSRTTSSRSVLANEESMCGGSTRGGARAGSPRKGGSGIRRTLMWIERGGKKSMRRRRFFGTDIVEGSRSNTHNPVALLHCPPTGIPLLPDKAVGGKPCSPTVMSIPSPLRGVRGRYTDGILQQIADSDRRVPRHLMRIGCRRSFRTHYSCALDKQRVPCR